MKPLSILLAIAFCWAWPDTTWVQILAGGAVAIAIAVLIYLFSLLFGPEAFGMGDVKMLPPTAAIRRRFHMIGTRGPPGEGRGVSGQNHSLNLYIFQFGETKPIISGTALSSLRSGHRPPWVTTKRPLSV